VPKSQIPIDKETLPPHHSEIRYVIRSRLKGRYVNGFFFSSRMEEEEEEEEGGFA